MLKAILNLFKTGPHSEEKVTCPDRIRKEHVRRRWLVVVGATIGYGMFYVARLSFNIVKKPLVDAGVFTSEELGYIGSALFFAYAFGKFTNGFLADRANIKRFMSFGLLVSAILNLCLGFTTSALVFTIIWGLNGWFQSMGAAPAVVALSNWVPSRTRGSVYGVWSLSHNLGDGLTQIFTSVLVASWGWQFGFYGVGTACIIAAVFLFFMLSDKPETYGLPPVDAELKAELKAEEAESEVKEEPVSVGKQQLSIATNPLIWLLGMCSALMYVSRYSVKSWANYYLMAVKDYTIEDAGIVLGVGAVFGIVGSASSGLVSDRFFNSRRGVTTVAFGVIQLIGMYLIFGPAGSPWLVKAGVACFEFGTGGLVVLLGGLIAVDVAGKKAAGAAMGVIGIFSYIGAGIQDIVSGKLITVTKLAERTNYDFGNAIYFWIGASICSLALTALFFFLLARKKKKEELEDFIDDEVVPADA